MKALNKRQRKEQAAEAFKGYIELRLADIKKAKAKASKTKTHRKTGHVQEYEGTPQLGLIEDEATTMDMLDEITENTQNVQWPMYGLTGRAATKHFNPNELFESMEHGLTSASKETGL